MRDRRESILPGRLAAGPAALLVGALLARVALVAMLALAPAAADAKRTYRVKVTRTSAGIPHVVARDFRSLGYGQGFAYAQDNACLFLDTVVTLRGERSRFFGSSGVSRVYSNGTVDPNPKSDAFWKWVEASGLRRTAQSGFGKQARQLYRGWLEGFNAYLKSGRLKDPACRGEPWVRKLTLRDMVLRGAQIITSAS
ncbi:MAG: penicillin acylase family protein, partial [Solirubrobacterales bacterium]